MNWWEHALEPVLRTCGTECLHFYEVVGVWFTGLATFGAVVTSLYLARQSDRERLQDRITQECGRANRLLSVLGRTLAVLNDLQESLFDAPARKLGRAPELQDLRGALQRVPGIIERVVVPDYDFLLETEDSGDRAAHLLGRIGHAQRTVDSIMSTIHERNEHAYRLQEMVPGVQSSRGRSAFAAMGEAGVLSERVEGLTRILRSDIPDAISQIRSVIPQLRAALQARYPGRQFLLVIPTDPNEPVL